MFLKQNETTPYIWQIYTLQGTNISPKNDILKMIFLFFKVGYVDSLEGKSYELILFLKPQAHAIFLQPPLAETPRPSVVRPPDRNWQPLESHEHNRWRPRSNYRVRISWHLVGRLDG